MSSCKLAGFQVLQVDELMYCWGSSMLTFTLSLSTSYHQALLSIRVPWLLMAINTTASLEDHTSPLMLV